MIGCGAAGIFAHVDHQAVLAPALRNQLFLELAKRRHAHLTDVQIAKLALRCGFHELAAAIEPMFVKEQLRGGIRDRPKIDVAGFAIGPCNRQRDLAIKGTIQDGRQVFSRDRRARHSTV